MLMNRRIHFVIGSLLSLWLFFGCLELAERLNLIPETTTADQAEQDPDREALSRLASGLKPDGPSLGAPCCASYASAVATALLSFSSITGHQISRLVVHGLLSLRLHQQLSVYRI
jgi:hypothetical protein